jgi:hypothetical protein
VSDWISLDSHKVFGKVGSIHNPIQPGYVVTFQACRSKLPMTERLAITFHGVVLGSNIIRTHPTLGTNADGIATILEH